MTLRIVARGTWLYGGSVETPVDIIALDYDWEYEFDRTDGQLEPEHPVQSSRVTTSRQHHQTGALVLRPSEFLREFPVGAYTPALVCSNPLLTGLENVAHGIAAGTLLPACRR